MAEIVTEDVKEIWVSTTEAASITGYNADYLQQIARKVWHQAEEERPFKILNRSRRYELWLPELIAYLKEHGHGPQRKRK